MNEPTLKLKNAPIIEAVLDIECDLPPGQQLSALESSVRAAFRDQYPKFRKQLWFEHQFEHKIAHPVTEPKTTSRSDLQALQLLTEDEKQLVQVRAAGFSFNRLSPYSSLDDYLPEIERTWRLYVEMATPVQIRLIRLRYINRILLPTVNGVVDLDDYLKVGPRLPDDARFQFAGFLIQQQAVEVETGSEINTVLTMQSMDGLSLPIIFDNSVAAQWPGDVKEWAQIRAKILELRELKNHIFGRTLTPKCLELFQR